MLPSPRKVPLDSFPATGDVFVHPRSVAKMQTREAKLCLTRGLEARTRIREVHSMEIAHEIYRPKLKWGFLSHALITFGLFLNSLSPVYLIPSLWSYLPHSMTVVWGLLTVMLIASVRWKFLGAKYVLPALFGMHVTFVLGPILSLGLQAIGTGTPVSLVLIEKVCISLCFHVGLAISAKMWSASIYNWLQLQRIKHDGRG